MASYAQIAQKTFSFDREDDTTRQWQFTFEKKNGTAQSFDIPIIEDVEVIQGNRSDAPNKPFKTHKANFTLNGVSESLITEITGAGLRDIRVTIVDTATSKTVFEGFVLPEFKKYSLYTDVQQVKVRCYGALADLDKISILPSQTITLDAFASDIATALDLDRELDVYSALHHDGALSSDPLPLDISFSEDDASGNDDEATLLDSLKSVMTALGWQAFQRNGRLIFADLYDRFNTPTTLNKHESDGLGGYTNTTENVEVSLDQTNILVDGERQDLTPVIALQQRHNLVNRDAAVFTDPSPHNQVKDTEGEHEMTLGMALEGDVITASMSGELITQPQETGSSGTNKFARIEIRDFITGDTFYFDPTGSGSWTLTETFLTDSFSFDPESAVPDSFSFSDTLPPVPENMLAALVIVTTCDPVMTTGSRVQILRNEFDSISVSISYADEDAQITHLYESASGAQAGDTLQGNTFAGDNDTHTIAQALQYSGTGTSLWNSPTGNGTLGAVVAERVGAIAVGKGVEFTVVIRDTTDIDLLSVVKIEDNDASILTCLPVEIRHRIGAGYYRVLLRQAFNGVTTTSNTYVSGVTTQAGTSTGGGTGGGGTGGLTVTQGDARYFRQINNLSEGTPATMLTNLGLTATAAELNRLDGTLATVQSNLGLKDGTAILDLASLTTGPVTGTTADFSGDVSMAGMTATGATINGQVGISTTPINNARLSVSGGAASNFIAINTASDSSTPFGILFSTGNYGYVVVNKTSSDGLEISALNTGKIKLGFNTDAAYGTSVFTEVARVLPEGLAVGLTTIPTGASIATLDYIDVLSADSDYIMRSRNDSVVGDLFQFYIKHVSGNVEIGNDRGDLALTSTIGTDNFVSQLTGWRGTYAGDWDVRSLFTDELRAKAFTADITQALAGSDFLTRSVAILDTDFTVPWGQKIVAVDTTNEVFEVVGDHTANVAVSNTLFVRESTGNDGTFTVASVTFNGGSGNTEITVNEDVTDATADGYIGKQGTISVEDLPGQNDIAVFTASDWIRLRIFDRSGSGLTIGDAWGLVTGYTDQADGTQDWTFTALDSGFVAGQDIFKGSIVLDYGQSGDGYIERTVLDDQGSPYSQVVTWTGNPIDNKTVKTRTGILDGIANASGAGFYGENTFLTESLLAGDLTKVSNYLEFASGVLTVNAEAFDLSATNILIDSALDRAKFGDATKFIDWNAGALSIASTVFDLNATTLVLENTTPKLALGASADTLGLSSASDTGTYLNGSGHVRIGTTDASGNLSKGFKFDGTNVRLESGNATIGAISGSFGPAGVLTYNATEVGLAGFTANTTRIEKTGNSDLYIGESLSTLSAEKQMLVGFWRDQANVSPFPILRIRAEDTPGGANFVQMHFDTNSNWGIQGNVDGTQVFGLGSSNFIGGTFFDANDLWLGSATKANATVLLDGVNGQIVTDSIGTIVISPSTVAAFTSNAEAPSITDEFFLETISRSANGSDSTSSTKRRSTFIKRFGADIILVHGVARQGGVDGGGAAIVERTSKIIATFTNRNPDATDSPVTGSTEISSTTDVQFSFQVDVSSLTNNDIIEVEIKAESSINISSYDSGTYTTETHLREDVDAQTSS